MGEDECKLMPFNNKKIKLNRRPRFKALCVGLAMGWLSLNPILAAAQNDGHLITMKDADITAFIEDVSVVTGKTFLIDPRVQGKVNIASEDNLTKAEVFQVFKDVMRVNNYSVIPTNNGEYRITLTQNAAQEAPIAYKNGVSGQLSTVVLKLTNGDAGEVAKLIRPVVHSQGRLSANPGGSVIIITDYPENIAKARAIIEAVDIDDESYDSVKLSHLSALEAETALGALQGARPDVSVVAVPATNSIIMRGPRSGIVKLRSALRAMDEPRVKSRSNVSVVPLHFADGESILSILTTLLPAYAVEGEPLPTVAHETGSNSIIISASPEVQDAMAEVIRQLDERRPQVMVEALIVEITDSTARDLGVQLGVAGTGSNIPLLTTNFAGTAPDLLTLTGALAGPGLGLGAAAQGLLEDSALASLTGGGLNGATAGFATTGGDAVFSAIINAVEADVDSNILSTPFVTTLDNVPATFLVGQDIPITTGQTLGADNSNPFNTVERQEVGIKLDVTPQISQGDVVRLEISQEVSSVDDALGTVGSTADFVINTSEITTTVLADNREIIVLGGLVQDDEEASVEQVPGLGSIPVFGRLFQSEGKSRVKTNLMVFIRPTIIRSGDDARPLTQERLSQARLLDRAQTGRPLSKLDDIWPQR